MMGLKLVKFCSFVNLYCSFRNSETQKLFRERRAQHSCQRQKPSFSYYYGHKSIYCNILVKKCSRRTYLKLAVLLAYSVVLPNNLLAQKVSESSEKSLTVFKTSGGTEYVDFRVGSGDSPAWGDMVVIHYVIYTVEGGQLRKFYSTYDDKQPFAFRHGNGQTIKGLEEGIDSMKVGGRRRMVIPGSLAYSVAGLGPIPPSTSVRRKLADSLKQGNVLSLDVELLKIWKDPVGMEYYSDFVPDVSKIPRSIFLKK
ncbi:immunophilin isoform 1 [Galdieria sulphuraria]|uniref:peptidylprolyl isomerase n=1 Tax=Galdieria sulphuraria TaxID=130081 RepID=M2X6Y4_GALSU|nr:immunophilin isoform 1 [Galdieria sulphuraria]EME32270.1 immunophilin isoform 1 [Galdieria sulphuraria]|eukprot:XP_005708790.1 immunophilin isoform 1 [Galdieria sulphuraria]